MKKYILILICCVFASFSLKASSRRLVRINSLGSGNAYMQQLQKPLFDVKHSSISSYFPKSHCEGFYSNHKDCRENALSASFSEFYHPWSPFMYYHCNPNSLKGNYLGFPKNENNHIYSKRKRDLSLMDPYYVAYSMGTSVLKKYLEAEKDYKQRSMTEEEDTRLSLFHYDLLTRKLYSVLDQMIGLSESDWQDVLKNFSKEFNIAMSRQELALYFINIDKALGKNKDREFISYPEISGLPVSLFYDKGVLTKAQVKDFDKRYDILDLVRQEEKIPKIIDYEEDIEISGKVYHSLRDIGAINLGRYESGKRLWNDGALCLSHALRNLYHADMEVLQRLSFIFDDCSNTSHFSDYKNVLSYLSSKGFPVLNNKYIFRGNIDFLCFKLFFQGTEYPFETRGSKIRLFDYSEEKLLKTHASIVFLEPPTILSSKVKNVTFHVLANGRLAACIIVDPIFVNKKRYSHFFINNFSQFQELDLHHDDYVQIICHSNKKPYIYSSFANSTGEPYLYPEICPKCKSTLIQEKTKNDITYRCAAHLVCESLDESLINRFVSAAGFNIKSLTPSIISEMSRAGVVTDVSDVLDIDMIDFQLLKNVIDDEKHRKILSDIDEAKRIKLGNFIYALCIPNITTLMANGLAHSLGTLERIKKATRKQLMTLNFLDQVAIESIIEFFSNQENLRLIEKILAKKVVITEYEDGVLASCYKDRKSITQIEYNRMIEASKEQYADSGRLDEEYDLIVDSVGEIEKIHPSWKKVEVSSHKRTIKTTKDFIKIQKTYSTEKLRNMLKKHSDCKFIEVLPKINGVACTLVFFEGYLQSAYTKGSRNSHLDIKKLIQKMLVLDSILLDGFSGIVRGELFLFREDAQKINEERIRSGLKPYVDSLSAIVSAVNKSYVDETIAQNLQFFGFGFAGLDGIEENLFDGSAVSKLLSSKDIGYTGLFPKTFENWDDAISYTTDGFSRRFETDMDIDGMVIRIQNQDKSIERYGYKFDVEKKTTKILGVSFSLSSTGKLVAIADVEPLVFQNGRTIKKVYIENHSLFDNESISVNDTVSVQFIGGVKASITSIKSKKNGEHIAFPLNCPQCSRALSVNKNGNRTCQNNLCKKSFFISQEISSFIKALPSVKHDDAFLRIVKTMVDHGVIKRKKDLFAIDVETLRSVCSLPSQDLRDFLKGMERIKSSSLLQVLTAIKGNKSETESLEKIADICRKPLDVFSLARETITQRDVSDRSAKQFLDFIASEKEDLQEILSHLVLPVSSEDLEVFDIDHTERELVKQKQIIKDAFQRDFKILEDYFAKIDNSLRMSFFRTQTENVQKNREFRERLKQYRREFGPLMRFLQKYMTNKHQNR